MNTIKCLVVDDEPMGREILESFVNKINFLQLVAVCEDAFEALEILETQTIDILFSDIQMPEINGLEFVRSLPSAPLIIFVTAHNQFAVSSYELGVTDYLLKPVSFDRFLKAVNKARAQIELQKQSPRVNSEKPEYIFIKADGKLHKILLRDILYIESVGDYVKIYHKSGQLISHCSMKEMEEKLPADWFIRIHTSHIVSVHAVKSVNTGYVELNNGLSFPVAKRRKEALFSALQIRDH